MNIKKLISALTLGAMLSSSIAVTIYAEDVDVMLDEKELVCPVEARIENGRTMVPMRAIFEALGMEVEWNNEERSVVAKSDKDEIKLTVGEKTLYINGEAVQLDVAPYIAEDTTLVPVRAVSESVDATVTWNDETRCVEIKTKEFERNKDEWKENIGEINLSLMSVSGDGAEVEGNIVKITDGGDFTVTGENDNAMIWVNTGEKVKLRLKGIKLTNPQGPAIFFENVGEALITISKDTVNYVTDGEEYSVDAKAAIFADDDIEIKGEGTLYVTSRAHHAIASDDDIKIEEGTLVLTSEKKDGIHANNTIKIKGGNITVTAYGDGIQSEEDIVIEDGEINVTTTGVVVNNGGWGGGPMGGFGENRTGRGNRGWQQNNQSQTAPEEMTPPEGFERPEGGMTMGEMTPPEGFERPEGGMPMGEMVSPEGMEEMTLPEGFERPEGGMQMGEMTPPEGMEGMTPPEMQDETVEDENTATKGIKAETNIEITGGKITVDSSDHAIHSAGTLNIKGGEMNLSSKSGKGISAHGDSVIDGGEINIIKATEGLESKANLTINGGKINITGSDDGINAGGTGGRDVANRNNAEESTGHDLIINGGEIFVNAQGDGLDANGRLIINGGNIVVEGPTNNGNGAIDSGGVVTVDGGTLIALGASGMAEVPSQSSKQPSFKLVTSTNIAQGTLITISDADGKEIYSYTTVKTGNSIVFSSKDIEVGKTYTVNVGEESYSIEMTQTVTQSGNGGGFSQRGGRW